MKIILIIVLLFYASILLAQTEDYTRNTLYRTFEEGAIYYTLQTKNVVFKSPSEESDTLNVLSIASPIVIEKRMEEVKVEEGFKTNWYQIAYYLGEDKFIGFIWGGDIAAGMFRAQNSDILFLYGVAAIQMMNRNGVQEPSIQLKLQAVRNNTCLDTHLFEAAGTLHTNTQGTAKGNRGLRNVREVIEIDFSDGYCGGVSATSVIFWDGQQLHSVLLLSHGFSDNQFSLQELIYPADNEGLRGRLMLRRQFGSINEQKKQIIEQQTKVFYIWNGIELRTFP